MSRPRVLMLTAYPAIGGPLPKLAPLVADGLRRCGCEVVIDGWSAHRAGPEPLLTKIVGRTADLARVHRRILTWQPDVIYVATAHNWPGLLRDLPLLFTVRHGRPPVVLHLHGSESDDLGQTGERLFTRLSILAARRAASVMLLSREELREWRRLCPEVEFGVVVNPFVPPAAARAAADARADAAPHEPTLLTVARLIPEKGVFDLLEALAVLRRSRPCRLLVAGMGPSRDALVRRIAELGLDDAVELLGYVSGERLDETYRRADLFVLPTYFAEGFPLSIMEAMSYGLPIVTTCIRGSADQIVEGENGSFCPSRDPKGLAQVLGRLLDDEALRARMGTANAARVAEYAPDCVVPQYAEMLRAAVAAAAAD